MPERQASTNWLWQATRIMFACALAYAGTTLLALPEGYWSLITSIVVTQPALDDTLTAGRDRVVGTVIGAAIGLLVTEAVRRGAPATPSFWMALMPLAVLTALWPNLRLSCVTLVVVALIPSSGATVERPLDRVLEILIGTLAALAVAGFEAVVRRWSTRR